MFSPTEAGNKQEAEELAPFLSEYFKKLESFLF
jgi:hypothetical protein